LDYNYFPNSKLSAHWKKIGIDRRSGVAVPLFSIYSNNSIGIGEFTDLKLLVKWCLKTNMSIIQILPINDVGPDFGPYNSVSSFALDPMYLALGKLRDVNLSTFKQKLRELKKLFPSGQQKVDYKIKEAKINVLREIYSLSYTRGINQFENFKKNNSYWLKNYAIYKVIKELNHGKHWEEWDDNLKNRDEKALKDFEAEYSDRINFKYWLQWQLYEQFILFKKYASKNGVKIIGDLPFLVSRDSADVWSNQKYFDLAYSSGAPPDMYFAFGQRWGMPPYNRAEMEKDNYVYIREKLKYAENFYDMYRIDHFVGFFRLWTIDINSDINEAGLNGKFIPSEEEKWKENGIKILEPMTESSLMLPIAEDLGTVPVCSSEVLWEYGIPGMNVQRWVKDENQNYSDPLKYRINSLATLSTHDSSVTLDWWKHEAGTVDEKLFQRLSLAKSISIEKFNSVKQILFDFSKSSEGRLFWKEDMDTVENFLAAFGFGYDFNWDLIKLYVESYDEKNKYLKFIGNENYNGKNPDTEFQFMALKKVLESSSIFAVNLFQEWLMLDEKFFLKCDKESCRINIPGVVNDSNWRFVFPFSLEYILEIGINSKIKTLNKESDRI